MLKAVTWLTLLKFTLYHFLEEVPEWSLKIYLSGAITNMEERTEAVE